MIKLSNRSESILRGMNPSQQAQAKRTVEGLFQGLDLGDLFKNLDLGEFGKKLIVIGIDFVQANILPKLQAKNPTLALVLAGLLEAVESALTK